MNWSPVAEGLAKGPLSTAAHCHTIPTFRGSDPADPLHVSLTTEAMGNVLSLGFGLTFMIMRPGGADKKSIKNHDWCKESIIMSLERYFSHSLPLLFPHRRRPHHHHRHHRHRHDHYCHRCRRRPCRRSRRSGPSPPYFGIIITTFTII